MKIQRRRYEFEWLALSS